MRGVTTHSAVKAEKAKSHSAAQSVDIRAIELDVQDEASVEAAVAKIIGAGTQGRRERRDRSH